MSYVILSISYSSLAPAVGVLYTSPTSLQATHVAPTTKTWAAILQHDLSAEVLGHGECASFLRQCHLCLQAFVCYAACLFSAKDALKRILPELSVPDNATCEHYCQLKVSKRSSLSTLIWCSSNTVSCTVTLKDGICERAFPPNSSCVMQCKLETCRQYCRHVMDEFPNTTGLRVLTCKSHTSHAIVHATCFH